MSFPDKRITSPPERGTGVRRTVPCFFVPECFWEKLVFFGRM